MRALLLITLLVICGCDKKPIVDTPAPVIVKKVEIKRPAPIVPEVDQLQLRPVNWVVITPENATEKLANLKSTDKVFFAMDKNSYENLSLNLSDIRSIIEQYKQIIILYKKQY